MRCMCGAGVCERCRQESLLIDGYRPGGLMPIKGQELHRSHRFTPINEQVWSDFFYVGLHIFRDFPNYDICL